MNHRIGRTDKHRPCVPQALPELLLLCALEAAKLIGPVLLAGIQGRARHLQEECRFLQVQPSTAAGNMCSLLFASGSESTMTPSKSKTNTSLGPAETICRDSLCPWRHLGKLGFCVLCLCKGLKSPPLADCTWGLLNAAEHPGEVMLQRTRCITELGPDCMLQRVSLVHGTLKASLEVKSDDLVKRTRHIPTLLCGKEVFTLQAD